MNPSVFIVPLVVLFLVAIVGYIFDQRRVRREALEVRPRAVVKPLVFILEDHEEALTALTDALEPHADVVVATNFDVGLDLFERYRPQYVLAIVGGWLNDRSTFDFAKELRKRGYKGPMLGNSHDRQLNDELRHAGCDLVVYKDEAPAEALKLLGARGTKLA